MPDDKRGPPPTAEEWRRRGDPEVDAIVARYFAERASPDMIETTRRIAIHQALPDEEQSPEVAAYLADRPSLPEWSDKKLLSAGEDFFASWGPEIGISLFAASLPAGYASAHGARVLGRTARLVGDAKRRVIETAQLLVYLLDRGGIDPGSPGYLAIRRVRLMHSAVRHLILNDASGVRWESGAWGVPINQQDLYGTMCTFSVVILDALRHAGVDYERAGADGFMHLWNVAGYLMGIDPSLLPVSIEQAKDDFTSITRVQYGPSSEGPILTSALLELMSHLLPMPIPNSVPRAAVRFFVGNEVADLLEVKRSPVVSAFIQPGRGFLRIWSRLERLTSPSHRMAQVVGRLIWKGLIVMDRQGDRAQFDMPVSLASAWNLPVRR
jgi:ER-bound oxygenase mpaB/B'/Rubber oxygenase, catalytic domain